MRGRTYSNAICYDYQVFLDALTATEDDRAIKLNVGNCGC
jgi:hypothetical protein